MPSDIDTQTIDDTPTDDKIHNSVKASNFVISLTPMDTTYTQISTITDEVNGVRVAPQRRKPTLVEFASSPIFKDDNTPKPLPDIL